MAPAGSNPDDSSRLNKSSNRPNDPDSAPKTTWRGKKSPAGKEARYRWQNASGKEQDTDRLRMNLWHRVKVGSFTLLSLVLIGWFVYYLINRAPKTPFITVALSAYPMPVAINPWAREDLDGFATLGGETLEFIDLSSKWASKERALESLGSQLQSSTASAVRSKLVVLYLSIHGMTDASGRPCLLFPNASPLLDSQSWLPLAEILERLKKLPDPVRKLLILDCNRTRTNWSLGVAYNSFADSLPQAVELAKVPGLVVLNSTSPGEVAWASPELRGSVFGHFLAQGLAGAADRSDEGGNADKRVSLSEISRYLQHHVEQWVRENRGDIQIPLIYPAESPELTVSYIRSGGFFSRPNRIPPKPGSGGSDESGGEAPIEQDITQLWNRFDEVSSGTSYRFDPTGWQHSFLQLLRLEEMSMAGKAYGTPAQELREELKGHIAKLDQARIPLPRLAAHSLPLADQFDRFAEPAEKRAKIKSEFAIADDYNPEEPVSYLVRTEAAWNRVLEDPSLETVSRAVKFIANPEPDVDPGVVEAHFLRMLQLHLDNETRRPRASDLIRSAIQTRHQAERVSALSGGESPTSPRRDPDERCQYWVYGLVDRADAERRLAEDSLFNGGAKSLEDARTRWSRATADYDSADATMKQTEEALSWRDRAWCQVPFLAQWFTRTQPIGQPVTEADKEVNTTLLPLIRGIHELAAVMEPSSSSEGADFVLRPDDLLHVKEKLKIVKDKLSELEHKFQLECDALRSAADDQATLQGISAALQVPLLPLPLREEFRTRARNISRKLQHDFPGTPLGQPGSKAASELSSRLGNVEEVRGARLDRVVVQWNRHPAVALLSRDVLEAGVVGKKQEEPTLTADAGTGDKLRVADELGETLRRFLTTLPTQSAQWAQDTVQDLPRLSGGRRALIQARAGLSRADRLVRAGAALLPDRAQPGLGHDPTRMLRWLDLHNLLVWHCQRTLDDFWGPITPTVSAESAFFAKAARKYLESAENLAYAAVGDASPSRVKRRPQADESVAELYRTRLETALNWATLDANAISPGEEDDEPEISHGVKVALSPSLPEGRVSVFLRDASESLVPLRDTNRIGNIRRFAVPTGLSSDGASQLDYLLNRADLEVAGKLEAVALFRGHQISRPIKLVPTRGIKLVSSRPENPPTFVTVSGQSTVRGAVVLILDCSASMGEAARKVGGEAENRRFDVARAAFDSLLTRLEQGKSYRVGVRFYGHRVGYVPRKGFEIQKLPNWVGADGKPIPNIRPGEDEEVIRPIGHFTPADHEALREKLKLLRPWGVTPLYLSLARSLHDDFRNEPKEVPKSVVVITDGMDYQEPNDQELRRELIRSIGDVLRESSNNDHSVRVYIVGFELDEKERNAASPDFEKIAQLTNGRFFLASNSAELAEVLEQLIPNQYAVVPTEAGIPGAAHKGWVDLDRRTEVRLPPSREQRKFPYTVAVKNTNPVVKADIPLEGGEGIQLQVSADGRGLEHRLYKDRVQQFIPPLNRQGLLDPRDQSRQYRLGFQRPDRRGTTMQFSISIQNANEKEFSPRPAEAWTDIVPVYADGPNPNQVYPFYDMLFEEDRPVPVLSCAAPEWPGDAKEADVRLWFKMRATEPTKRAKVGSVANRTDLKFEGLPNLTFGVQTKRGKNKGDPYRVIVTERHPSSDPNFFSAKVALNPPAQKTSRRFDPESNIILHTFYLPDIQEAEIANDYELQFTSRKSLEADSVQLSEPVRIRIPGTVDTLR